MKLESILSITNPSTNVYIHQDGEIVSYYDGKNSIDLELNDNEVIKQWIEKDGLHIEIELA